METNFREEMVANVKLVLKLIVEMLISLSQVSDNQKKSRDHNKDTRRYHFGVNKHKNKKNLVGYKTGDIVDGKSDEQMW